MKKNELRFSRTLIGDIHVSLWRIRRDFHCDRLIDGANGDFGRSYRHYMYQGKVYKSLDKFLEAIKDVELKRIERWIYPLLKRNASH